MLTMDVLKLQELPEAVPASGELGIFGASSFISVFNHCRDTPEKCSSN